MGYLMRAGGKLINPPLSREQSNVLWRWWRYHLVLLNYRPPHSPDFRLINFRLNDT
jgi:hypothetical protein